MGGVVSQILEIIKRHYEDEVFVVAKRSQRLILYSGILSEADDEGITLTDETGIASQTRLLYENEGEKLLYHIYNRNHIDLLNATTTPTLAMKLKEKEKKKAILVSLKPYLKQILFFVHKHQQNIHVSSGRFYDMGMMGISLKLPPFFNKDLNLSYNSILHIYNQEYTDLIL